MGVLWRRCNTSTTFYRDTESFEKVGVAHFRWTDYEFTILYEIQISSELFSYKRPKDWDERLVELSEEKIKKKG